MPAIVDLTEQDIYAAVRRLIVKLLDCEVIQGLDNGVAMPAGGFVAMTILFKTRLSTNVEHYTDDVKEVIQSTQVTLQIDCYGAQSERWAQIISTMWRDAWACEQLAPVCQPLHADEPRHMPITNAEQQYEKRWLITAALQYNPTVTVEQQFFTSAPDVSSSRL
jgi:hypothetical protein